MAASALNSETVHFIEAYNLTTHNAELRDLLDLTNITRPTIATASNMRRVEEIVTAFRTFHTDYPYVVAPPSALNGHGVRTPLRQVADDQTLTLTEQEFTEHIGIFGRSGGGKTTCAHHFAHEAYRRGLRVVTIDGKDDARSFPVTYPDTLVISKDTPIPLLEPPSWLSSGEAVPQLTKPLRETMWGGEGLEQIAIESLAHTFEHHERPCVVDWRNAVRALAHKGDTYTRRDRCDGLALRLDRLISKYPGLGTTRVGEGITLETLCNRSLYFGFGLHTQVEDFLTQWLLELRFSYNRAHTIRGLNTLILLDESNLLVHDKTISEQAPLAATFPLLREFGMAVCLTAANYRSIPPQIKSSLYLQIAMNLTDAAEANDIARTFGMTSAQRDYLDTKLTRGTCIAKLGDRWKHPFLAHVAPLVIPKTIDPTQWRDALTRTNALARTAAAREAVPQPAPAKPSPSASHAVAAPLIKPQIALNTHAETLLKLAAQEGVIPTTEAFRHLDIHPQAGTRAKKQLLDLALIEEERITIRRGRGGTAVAIRPTACGYERAGIKSHGTRGGDSIQHEYLVRSLAKRITGARIDARAGTKACDLLIPYNAATHQQLATLIGITPRDGEHIAIEVEVSDPDRTATRNISRNTEAGIAHTIIATMTPLRRKILGVVVMDVFALMEAL